MMDTSSESPFVSRGGEKLAAAIKAFDLDVGGAVCADLGSHVGGFVDCLLRHGAKQVYSVDTAYGLLAWRLRKDPRVVVLERTNAMHVTLPKPVDLVTIDVGWTTQSRILPNAARLLAPVKTTSEIGVISLIKPHYEAPSDVLQDGVLPDAELPRIVAGVIKEIQLLGWEVLGTVESPLRGHGGNREVFARLGRADTHRFEKPIR